MFTARTTEDAALQTWTIIRGQQCVSRHQSHLCINLNLESQEVLSLKTWDTLYFFF